MKQFFAAMALAVLAIPAAAEIWKDTALEKVAEYSRVKEASWSEANTLWLFVYDADVSWETVTDGFICPQLISAGKPLGEAVLVSWFSYEAALQGNSDRLAKAWCP